MPHITIHFLIARNALRAWRKDPADAPFDLNDRSLINAFYHGALGPDMGYFPGGCEHMSNLLHESRASDMNRVLLRSATTERDRAYAFGWLTHILADAALHPIINQSADALLRRQGGNPNDALARRIAHVRVELGLDAAFLACARDISLIRIVPCFDEAAVEHVRTAFNGVYSHTVDRTQIMRSHHAAAFLASAWLFLERIVGRNFARMRAGPLARRARAITRASILYALRSPSLNCSALGFVTPVQPTPWMLRQAEAAVSNVGDVLRAPALLVLETLPNVNLDTGVERLSAGRAPIARRRPLRSNRDAFVTFSLQNLSVAET